jgi:hypothetical protein
MKVSKKRSEAEITLNAPSGMGGEISLEEFSFVPSD